MLLARILRKLLRKIGFYDLLSADIARSLEGPGAASEAEARASKAAATRAEAAAEAVAEEQARLGERVVDLEQRTRGFAKGIERRVMELLELPGADPSDDVSEELRRRYIGRRRRQDEARCRERIESIPGWRKLEQYLEATKSTGCSWADYWTLYSWIRRRKPAEVLECGTGTSTIVMALALLENATEGSAGRLTSMESVREWYDVAQQLLPADLSTVVDLRHSEPVEYAFSMFRGMGYASLPERPYELVFIDGPSTVAPDGVHTFDFDYINVVARSQVPVQGIIDTRLSSCYALQQIFGRSKFRYDEIRMQGWVGPCTADDLRPFTESSSPAFRHSVRLFGKTRFDLEIERERD